MCNNPPNIYLFKVNDVVLVFLLLTLNIFRTLSSVSIVDFEQVNVSWVCMIMQRRIQNSIKCLNWSVFRKAVKYFHKTLQRRCLTGFWICLCYIFCKIIDPRISRHISGICMLLQSFLQKWKLVKTCEVFLDQGIQEWTK